MPFILDSIQITDDIPLLPKEWDIKLGQVEVNAFEAGVATNLIGSDTGTASAAALIKSTDEGIEIDLSTASLPQWVTLPESGVVDFPLSWGPARAGARAVFGTEGKTVGIKWTTSIVDSLPGAPAEAAA